MTDQAKKLDPGELRETIEYLQQRQLVTARQADRLRDSLAAELEAAGYILKNLGAHLSIGVVFAFDVVPLPLGTIGRVGWVAGARIVETLRNRPQRARIHSMGVFLIAAIPWFGYAAYLLPLRRQSGELAFVIANHSWRQRTGRTYEEFLAGASAPMRRFGRWLVPVP